jgi:putative addiction module component (TIGR02574 family)
MSEHPKLAEILELPAEERLALAEAIWDSLTKAPASIPTPAWHRDVIAERLAEDNNDKRQGETWEELRARIEKRE